MRIATSLVALAFLVIVIYFVGSDEGTGPEERSVMDDEMPIILQQAEMTDYEKNNVKWKMWVDTAKIYQKRDITLITRINGEIPSGDGSGSKTIVSSEFGQIDGKSDIVRIWDNVKVTFDDGRQLLTDELLIDQGKEIIYNETTVTVLSKSEEIVAESMVYDIQTGKLNLFKPKAKIQLEI